MAESIINDRPPVAAPTAIQRTRNRQRVGKAVHLDCSRTYIGKLEAEGVSSGKGGEEGNPRCASC
jgi:hypothetical protein